MRLNGTERELNKWLTIWDTALNVKVLPNVCSILFFFLFATRSLTTAGLCVRC